MTERVTSKILVVDDKKTNRELLSMLLLQADEGYKVVQADSGRAALDAVEREKPDIILLDVIMPDIDGFEVCQRLKKHEKHQSIPILFITAMNKPEDMVKCFSVGAADYISKPINPEEVKTRVKAHLRIKRAEEEKIQITNLETVKNMVVTYNHNMNQPLMAAITYLEILLSQNDPKDKKHLTLSKIKNELSKVTAILKKIDALQQLKRVDYVGNTQMIDLE
ncbi:MAG: response regulator [Candidatus Omnitrophica bacterium]|nr:response regulator [Candidatus Omnitrophota bacterium]